MNELQEDGHAASRMSQLRTSSIELVGHLGRFSQLVGDGRLTRPPDDTRLLLHETRLADLFYRVRVVVDRHERRARPGADLAKTDQQGQ